MAKVLCIPRNLFLWSQAEPICTELAKSSIESWQTEVQWLERQETENSESFVQLIPYTVVTSPIGVAAYSRGDENEERLFAYHSIGYGGHIDPVDQGSTLAETVLHCTARELHEEAGIVEFNLFPKRFLIISNEDEVSRAHLGILQFVEHFKQEPSAPDLHFYAPEDAKKLKLESWSKMALDTYIGVFQNET